MGVTILKDKQQKKATKKVVAKSKTEGALAYIKSIADEAGTLQTNMALKKLELKELEQQYTELVKPIQPKVDGEYDPKKTLSAAGKHYTCKVGVKVNKTTVKDSLKTFNMFKKLGGDKLLSKLIKFSVTDIKNYLTEEEQAEVIDVQPEGNRRITFIKQ